jgi:hypothetical protein
MSFDNTSLRGLSLMGRCILFSWLSTSWKMGPCDDERGLRSFDDFCAFRLFKEGITRVNPEPAALFMWILGDSEGLYDGEKEVAFSSINFMINHDFVADFHRQQLFT